MTIRKQGKPRAQGMARSRRQLVWAMPILVLAPLGLGARGCGTGVVGDDCIENGQGENCAGAGAGAGAVAGSSVHGGTSGRSGGGGGAANGGRAGATNSGGRNTGAPAEGGESGSEGASAGSSGTGTGGTGTGGTGGASSGGATESGGASGDGGTENGGASGGGALGGAGTDGGPPGGLGCWICEAGEACHVPRCGDGYTDDVCVADCGSNSSDPQFVWEGCDDGNDVAGDGCTNCRVDPGYACGGYPYSCHPVTCGDGIKDFDVDEVCDDGNDIEGDGCTGCQQDPGWYCESNVCKHTCGNGLPDGGDPCDDGNLTPNDGCDADCRIEPGWACPNLGKCAPVGCGNGIVELAEDCDDGNTGTGDGCDADCRIEPGYVCTRGSCHEPACGDGINEFGDDVFGWPPDDSAAGAEGEIPQERCDDGNTDSGDGCDSHCQAEPGYWCTSDRSDLARLSQCDPLSCGNGILQSKEICDDGNTADGDGCTSDCRVETGYDCPVNGRPCVFVCGNGDLNAGIKRCEDGNVVAGDGCSPTCSIEPGWSCPGGKPCSPIACGNGRHESGEECDDGNDVDGDGCTQCVREYACITFVVR